MGKGQAGSCFFEKYVSDDDTQNPVIIPYTQ